MPNFRMIGRNGFDAATVGVTPAAATNLAVTNLQDSTRRPWRSTSAAAQTIAGNFLDLEPVAALAIMRHNITSSGTIRLRLYADVDQTGTLLYDSGNLVVEGSGSGTVINKGWGEFVWGTDPWGGGSVFTGWTQAYTAVWFAKVTQVRSFSIVITDTGNPAGYVEASRVFLGDYFEPQVNVSYGAKFGWFEDSKQYRTDGGSLRTDPMVAYRRFRYKLGSLSDVEREELTEILRLAGKREDMFVALFPEMGGTQERNFSAQVKLVDPLPEFDLERYDRNVIELHFEET